MSNQTHTLTVTDIPLPWEHRFGLVIGLEYPADRPNVVDLVMAGNIRTAETATAQYAHTAGGEWDLARYVHEPCTGDEPTGPDDEPDDPEYDAWCEAQVARGELAFAPERMECYACGGFDGVTFKMQDVVALGPVTNRADATQTYKLACGHTAF